jgi:hypothetical protein
LPANIRLHQWCLPAPNTLAYLKLDEKVFKDRALGYKEDWCVAFFSSFDATSVAAGVEKKEREKKRFGHSLKPDVDVFKNAS